MAPFLYTLLFHKILTDFQNFFYCQNQKAICNKTIAIDPNTPQVCRYTTLWNVRPRTQANDVTDQRRSSLLTICDSQPAEAGDRRWVGQTAAALPAIGVAVLDASSSSKADTLNIWCKNYKMWLFRDNNWDNKDVVSVVNFVKIYRCRNRLVFNCYS